MNETREKPLTNAERNAINKTIRALEKGASELHLEVEKLREQFDSCCPHREGGSHARKTAKSRKTK
jgi:hypothetical protein